MHLDDLAADAEILEHAFKEPRVLLQGLPRDGRARRSSSVRPGGRAAALVAVGRERLGLLGEALAGLRGRAPARRRAGPTTPSITGPAIVLVEAVVVFVLVSNVAAGGGRLVPEPGLAGRRVAAPRLAPGGRRGRPRRAKPGSTRPAGQRKVIPFIRFIGRRRTRAAKLGRLLTAAPGSAGWRP